MRILAHRGYWEGEKEKNSPKAIRAALERGYGFESDVRDYEGRMVISHNIADSSCQDAEKVFQWLHEFNDSYCFAINIKADGLKDILKEFLQKYKIENYFLFDMSVPQMVEFSEAGLKFFTRQSEFEPCPCLYEQAGGVWVDGFYETGWITEELLRGHIENGKTVCIVSTDLHGKESYKDFWKTVKSYSLDFGRVMLCTDHPDEASEFFKDKL